MSRDPRIPWHELLGKALTDALIGLPYSVSTEEELALRDLPHSAPWRLFCSNKAQQRAALQQYHPHSEIGLHLYSLLAHHLLGDGTLAHTFEDMQREAHEWLKESIRKLDPDEVLQCYAPEERLKGLDAEERLKGLEPEERLKGLEPDDVFSRFDPATIEAWLKKHRRDH